VHKGHGRRNPLHAADSAHPVQQVVLVGAGDLQVQSTPSDGNCLFTAIALQLQLYGINKSASTVRKELVSYMTVNTEKVDLVLTSYFRKQ